MKAKKILLLLVAAPFFFLGCSSGSNWWEWTVPARTFTNNPGDPEKFFTFAITVGEGEIIRGISIFYGEEESCFLDIFSSAPGGIASIEEGAFSFPINTLEVQGMVGGYFKTPFILEASYQLESALFPGECPGSFSDNPRALGWEEPSKRSFFPDLAPFRGITRANPGCRCLAWGDFDSDGDDDLFAGVHLEGFSTSPELIGPRLYRNNRGETMDTFAEEARSLGLLDPQGHITGCAWGDFNGDGLLDLYLCRDPSPGILYQQTPLGAFEESGLAGEAQEPGSMAVWVDFDGDGLLDLSASSGLFINNYPDPFTKMDPSPRMNGPFFEWADFDLDGDPDLYCLLHEPDGDRYDHLYRNDGGSFSEVGLEAGLNLLYRGDQAAWGDFNRDGYPDLAVISSSQKSPSLFQNSGAGSFFDVTSDALFPEQEWGSCLSMVDFNNDGHLDLVCATQVERHPYSFLTGDGAGRFKQSSSTLSYPFRFPGRSGMAWADYDGDGDLDLALATQRSLALFTNHYQNHFIQVQAITDSNGNADEEDDEGNRYAVGARIEVDLSGNATFFPQDTLNRWPGFRAQDSPAVPVGIGGYPYVSVRVTFPDGSQVLHEKVLRDTILIVLDY